jgi:teichuronic acid exporter
MNNLKTTSVEETSVKDEALIDRAAHSVKWSILYNVVPRLVTPFSTLILAALLTPADFGLVAVSTFIVALARIVVDLGLGKAIIQRKTFIDESASISLWVSIFIGGVLYLFLWFAAPWISILYSNNKITDIVRVAAFILPLTSLASVPKALLRRKMEFNRLFWVYSSFLIIESIASIIFAFMGFGPWAVIWGQLIGMTISTALAWILVRWVPMLTIKWDILRPLLSFSVWVVAIGFQEWLFTYADNAIAGIFLGVQGLGIYSLGFTMATLIPGFMVSSLEDVAYPSFCKLQDNPQDIGQKLVGLQRLTGSVLFPVSLGISAIASPVIELLYGPKWPGLGMVIAFLVIMPGLSNIWVLNDSAYQAIGRPDISAKISGTALLVLIPLLWITAPYGLLVFTLARFGSAWLVPLGNILFGTRVLHISLKQQFKSLASPLLFSLLMYLIVYMMVQQLAPFIGIVGWIKLILAVSVGIITYLSFLWITNRVLLQQLVISVRQVLS